MSLWTTLSWEATLPAGATSLDVERISQQISGWLSTCDPGWHLDACNFEAQPRTIWFTSRSYCGYATELAFTEFSKQLAAQEQMDIKFCFAPDGSKPLTLFWGPHAERHQVDDALSQLAPLMHTIHYCQQGITAPQRQTIIEHAAQLLRLGQTYIDISIPSLKALQQQIQDDPGSTLRYLQNVIQILEQVQLTADTMQESPS